MIAALYSEMKCQGQSSRPLSLIPDDQKESVTLELNAMKVRSNVMPTKLDPPTKYRALFHGKLYLKQIEPLNPKYFAFSHLLTML